ncbi:MAG TPA: hypothetical protein VF340_02980 [Methyloceanibacter sp.]
MRSLPILAVFAFLPVFWLPPTGASAASVCDAPFTGCLAKCGNKVTTTPQDNDEQRGCFYGCRLARLSCEKQQPGYGHGHGHHHP